MMKRQRKTKFKNVSGFFSRSSHHSVFQRSEFSFLSRRKEKNNDKVHIGRAERLLMENDDNVDKEELLNKQLKEKSAS